MYFNHTTSVAKLLQSHKLLFYNSWKNAVAPSLGAQYITSASH